DLGLNRGIHAHDPKPPDFDQAVKRGWSRRRHGITLPGEDDPIVRDEARTLIDGPERQVGLAAARRPAEQDPVPVDGDAGGVDRDHGGRGWAMVIPASITAVRKSGYISRQ